jgi:hypothetical protein
MRYIKMSTFLHTKFVAERNLAVGASYGKGEGIFEITSNNSNKSSIPRHLKTFFISVNMYVK